MWINKKCTTGYIDKCRFCTIATVSKDGQPSASTVSFNNVGMDIYFNTARDSKKIQNILFNPRVSIAMQKPRLPKTDQEITGIQYSGTARILSDDEIAKAPKAVVSRNRLFNSLKPGSSVVVKVTPLEIYLIDYSRGFRYRASSIIAKIIEEGYYLLHKSSLKDYSVASTLRIVEIKYNSH